MAAVKTYDVRTHGCQMNVHVAAAPLLRPSVEVPVGASYQQVARGKKEQTSIY